MENINDLIKLRNTCKNEVLTKASLNWRYPIKSDYLQIVSLTRKIYSQNQTGTDFLYNLYTELKKKKLTTHLKALMESEQAYGFVWETSTFNLEKPIDVTKISIKSNLLNTVKNWKTDLIQEKLKNNQELEKLCQ